MILDRRGAEKPNREARILHAHRRDFPQLDNEGLGCSSKMGWSTFIAHNLHALQDSRDRGARNPPIQFGSVCQHWCRNENHPSRPGRERTPIPPRGHYPDDPIFERGHGRVPAGHPGNNSDLPPALDNIGMVDKGRSARHAKSSSTYRSSYAKVPSMRPYDPIPPPSGEAAASATAAYRSLQKSSRKFVEAFEYKFYAWQKIWYSPALSTSSRLVDQWILPSLIL